MVSHASKSVFYILEQMKTRPSVRYHLQKADTEGGEQRVEEEEEEQRAELT